MDRADPYGALAERLARVHGVRRQATRDRALEAVWRRLEVTVDCARHPALLDDLYSLVSACDRWPGGLRLLLDELGWGVTGTVEWPAVEVSYRRLYPESLLTPEEHRSLLALLTSCELPDEERHHLALGFLPHVQAHAPGARPGPDAARQQVAESLVSAFEDASHVPAEPHPLICFLEALAVREHEPLTGRLRSWNLRVARRLGCPEGLLEQVRDKEASRAGKAVRPSRLLIEVSARPAAPADLQLRGWFVAPGSRGESLIGDRRVTSRAELDATVARLHEQALSRFRGPSEALHVEFVLPRSHLWLDVDQIEIRPDGGMPRELGAESPVTVRGAKHFRSRRWWPRIRRRLDWLDLHPWSGLGEPATWWFWPGDPLDARELLARLRNSVTPVCLVLLDPPPYDGDLAGDVVDIMLEAGMPAILAVHGETARRAPRDELRDALDDRLVRLPERIRLLRGGYDSAGERISGLDLRRGVSLVWESSEGLEAASTVLEHPRAEGAPSER
ncbi:hypothetical protein RM780_26785 [Streptomyces sp. DSM 44917]|uniref:Uncharacterized protein n=1 Tax=Streptomyces boetiae TaxID=3075541 RepID=A0ABU2LG09_9ACTN|nr:hypothetical protein [Streptomyces sp. DSM 44917]MDT0310525.1 hypothetical protein [Streptomyces sp. DSM 44917]